MRAPLLTLLIMGCLALPGVASQPDRAVVAISEDGRILACGQVRTGDAMTLTFTHSMYGGDVRETYQVTPEGTLTRTKMVADRAAAAEYYATDGRVATRSDGYEVIALPFITSALVVRVDARGDHRLTIGATTVSLANQVTEPTQVRIGIMTTGCGDGKGRPLMVARGMP